MKKRINFFVAAILVFLLILTSSGCGKVDDGPQLQSKDLMRTISESQAERAEISSEFENTVFDFSVDLFKTVASEKLKQAQNSVISPSAALASLSIALSGASGETEKEFQSELYPKMELGDFSMMSSSFIRSLCPTGATSFKLLSSMWIDRNVKSSVKEDFLVSNARYYGADIYKSDFTSKEAAKDINKWFAYRSGGSIGDTDIGISDDGMIYLVDALAFNGAWETPYKSGDMSAKEFEDYSGDTKTVDFMVARDVTYLSDSYSVGFSKPYSGGKYSFVAILPNDHISINDYITMLNGEILQEMLKSGAEKTAVVQIPQIEDGFSGSIKQYLNEIGFNNIFNKNANFTKIMREEEKTYITDIYQKFTFEAKAGEQNGAKNTEGQATTVGERVENNEEDEIIVFNRPFVYAVVDNDTRIPLIIGTVLNV